jgi:hypothetical protein
MDANPYESPPEPSQLPANPGWRLRLTAWEWIVIAGVVLAAVLTLLPTLGIHWAE